MKEKVGKKLFVIRFVSWLLVVACMTVIFSFSTQPLKESNETSTNFTESVLENTFPSFDEKNKQEKSDFLADIMLVVRKSAHFAIFVLLGFLFMNALHTYKLKTKLKVWLAVAFTTLYAISDEVHQLFTAERTGQITDVLIDTLGGISGIFLFLLVVHCIKKLFTKTQTGN